MSIQQAILQMPIVNPDTGMLTEYGRQLISDNIITTTNRNSSEIESNEQLSMTGDAVPSFKASDVDLPAVNPLPQDVSELLNTILFLQQEVLRLHNRVEDLENGS